MTNDWSDKNFVLERVRCSGWELNYASDELKNDPDVVLSAVCEDGLALRFASNELKNNRAIVLAAIENDPWSILSASDELKNDREIFLTAVLADGDILMTAHPENNNNELFRNDREIVLAAVRQKGHALEFAGETLKNDPELIAISRRIPEFYQNIYVDMSKKNEWWMVFVEKALRYEGTLLKYVPEELTEDEDLCLIAVKSDLKALQYCSYVVKDIPEFIIEVVNHHAKSYYYDFDSLVEEVKKYDGVFVQREWFEDQPE